MVFICGSKTRRSVAHQHVKTFAQNGQKWLQVYSSLQTLGNYLLRDIYKLVQISRRLPRQAAQKNSATARISFERSSCICPHYVLSTLAPGVQFIPLRVTLPGHRINIIAMTEPTLSAHKQYQLPTDMKREEHGLTTRSFTNLYRISMTNTNSTCAQGSV